MAKEYKGDIWSGLTLRCAYLGILHKPELSRVIEPTAISEPAALKLTLSLLEDDRAILDFWH